MSHRPSVDQSLYGIFMVPAGHGTAGEWVISEWDRGLKDWRVSGVGEGNIASVAGVTREQPRFSRPGNWHIRHPSATEEIGVHVFRLWVFKENSNVVNGKTLWFTGSDHDRYGRLKVIVDGKWGNVCGPAPNYGLTPEDTRLLCRYFGLTDGQIISAGSFGDVREEVRLANIRCRGNERSILDCSFILMQNVSNMLPRREDNDSSKDGWNWRTACSRPENKAALYCYNKVRISNFFLPLYYGILEVNVDGVWSAVCDRGFQEVHARVACRDMGFKYGKFQPGSVLGPYNGSISVTNMSCTGEEAGLGNCSYAVGSCSSGSYVTVYCSPTLINTTSDVHLRIVGDGSEATLEATKYGIDGPICPEGWDNTTAFVACRQLGFTGGEAFITSSVSSKPMVLGGFQCAVGVETLNGCRYRGLNEATGCQYQINGKSSIPAAGVKCYKGKTLRFTGSGHDRYGRLKVTVDGKWGNVCGPAPNYGLMPEDARVLCRYFGLTDGQIIPSDSFGNFQTKDEIRLTSIRCRGNEMSIWNCSYDIISNWRPRREDYDVDNWTWRTIQYRTPWWTTCPLPKHKAALYCYNKVRLSKFYQPYYGILEVNVDGVWSAVCDRDFQEVHARVACRDMGFKDGRFQSGSVLGPYNGSISVTNLFCTGEEADLGNCSYAIGSCSSGGYVTVYCSSTLINRTDAADLRIVGNGYEGTIEANKYGFWGPICPEGWDNTTAFVACRHLGFSGGEAFLASSVSRQPMVLGGFQCAPGVETLDDCRYSGLNETSGCQYQIPTANSIPAAGVKCYRNVFTLFENNPGPVKIGYEQKHGYACPNTFDDFAAMTMCKSLGYKGGFAYKHTKNNLSAEMPWLLKFNCSPNAFNNGSCGNITWGTALGCEDGSAAAAYCYNNEGYTFSLAGNSNVMSGRLEISIDGTRGTVCGPKSGFSQLAASVVCRQMGFEDGVNVSSGQLGDAPVTIPWTIYISDINCRGDETSLWDCPSNLIIEVKKVKKEIIYRSEYERMFKVKEDYSQPLDSQPFSTCHSKDDSAAVYCYNKVRLANSNDPSYGILEMKVSGSWGVACYSGFHELSARVACRQMGFKYGIYQPDSRLDRRNGTASIVGLSCTGNETDLSNCTYRVGRCQAGSYVRLFCSESIINSSGDILDLNVIGAGYQRAGEANMMPSLGTPCPVGLDNITAITACRNFGYSWGLAYNDIDTSGKGATLGNVQCVVSGKPVHKCKSHPWVRCLMKRYDPMPNRNALCYNGQDEIQIRLAEAGVIEIKFNGTWGGICARGFGRAEASVVCRQMGYFHSTVRRARGSGRNEIRVLMDNLRCNGREPTVFQCNSSWIEHATCKPAVVLCWQTARYHEFPFPITL